MDRPVDRPTNRQTDRWTDRPAMATKPCLVSSQQGYPMANLAFAARVRQLIESRRTARARWSTRWRVVPRATAAFLSHASHRTTLLHPATRHIARRHFALQRFHIARYRNVTLYARCSSAPHHVTPCVSQYGVSPPDDGRNRHRCLSEWCGDGRSCRAQVTAADGVVMDEAGTHSPANGVVTDDAGTDARAGNVVTDDAAGHR